MSKTTLDDSGGFTPVLDVLVQELGRNTALVFGRVWRYCQGEMGVCWASMTLVGRGVGLSREAAMRHVKRLVEGGFLVDLTPGLRNRPHSYADTGKAGRLQALRAPAADGLEEGAKWPSVT